MTKKLFNTKAFSCASAVAFVFLSSPGFAAGQAGKTDPLQIHAGQKRGLRIARCHNLASPKELTDEEWHVSVTHMRVRANLPGSVADDIIAFLKASN